MKKRLSFQWRLTLTAAALVTVACILLTILISSTALLQLSDIKNTAFDIEMKEGEMMQVRMTAQDVFPDLEDMLRQSQKEIVRYSVCAMVLVILTVSAATYFLTGRALRPLRTLSGHMETVQAQNLARPLEVPETGDELMRLSKSFNGMMERLNEAFAVQKQFSANAAHELRTPLAVMQTELEVLGRYDEPSKEQYQETFRMLKEQTGRLGHLVELLLELTQLGTVARNDRISLGAMVEEVLCDLAPVAEKRKVELVQEEGDAQITGSDMLLYRAVYNLVENAVKYNHEGGSVSVSCDRRGKLAFLTVRDTGMGIPRENWEQIFAPFFRVNKGYSREIGGAGLGLALVGQIADLHGGSVRVTKSSEEGTEITMSLPAG